MALIGRYQALDVDIVYPSLPSEKEDTILPILDQWAEVDEAGEREIAVL